MEQVLSGAMLLLIDGIKNAAVLDVRQYVTRGSEEPSLEKVTRGSRDGFVETALFNVNLIRRRIRDPKLRFEALQVGRRSKTDILVGYIEDIADPSLVGRSRAESKPLTGMLFPWEERTSRNTSWAPCSTLCQLRDIRSVPT